MSRGSFRRRPPAFVSPAKAHRRESLARAGQCYAVTVERIFYDGTCALCHWAVRFVVPRDPHGIFRFAPLDSGSFRTHVAADLRAGLPDSLVVVTAEGRVLTRSEGVLHILSMLGGVWRPLSALARLVPRPLRDWSYDRVAATRYRLFGTTAEVCPIVPAHLRARFDA